MKKRLSDTWLFIRLALAGLLADIAESMVPKNMRGRFVCGLPPIGWKWTLVELKGEEAPLDN